MNTYYVLRLGAEYKILYMDVLPHLSGKLQVGNTRSRFK